jgi:hypothetical protein
MPDFSIASFNSSSIFDITVSPFQLSRYAFTLRITHNAYAGSQPFRRPLWATKQGKHIKPLSACQELFSKSFSLTFKISEGNLIFWIFGDFPVLFTLILAVAFCNQRLNFGAVLDAGTKREQRRSASVQVWYE